MAQLRFEFLKVRGDYIIRKKMLLCVWGEGVPLGHLWVLAWTDNAYLNLRALLRVLFHIISSSRRGPEEFFLRSGNSPASVCPSNSPSINISCYRISSSSTGRICLNLVRMFPSVSCCASTKNNSGPSTNMAAVGHVWFFLLLHLLRNYLTDSNGTCLLTGWLSHLLHDHWSDVFRYWSECSRQCLVVQEPKPKSSLSKNMAAVGHLWFFLLSHRLRNEWNLPIKLASMSSWIQVKWWNLAFRFPASLSVRFNAYM